MSRAAIYHAITTNSELNALDIDSSSVFPNWASSTRPKNDGPFIILRWGELIKYVNLNGHRNLEVWVHYPKELTEDYTKLDNILNLVDAAILSLEQTPGGDGQTVTCVESQGRSADAYDSTYNTIMRNGSFRVLSHTTLASELL